MSDGHMDDLRFRQAMRRRLLLIIVAITAVVGFIGIRPSIGAAVINGFLRPLTVSPHAGLQKIQHIVFIVQENRSFDSYFGTYPGADGIMNPGTPTPCVPDPAHGGCIASFHDARDKLPNDLPHGTTDAQTDINGGKMNGFVASYETFCAQPGHCLDGSAPSDPMGYHDARDIPNYWTYAQQFVLQDHMYAPNSTYSLPSHLALLSAWSAYCPTPGVPTACVNTLDPQKLQDTLPTPTPQPRPHYSWTDITYLLHQHSVSWAYYVPNGTINSCPGSGPTCFPPPGQQQAISGTPEYWNPLPFFGTVANDGQMGNIQKLSNFTSAAAAGTLPAVSWIMPTFPQSEHPPSSIRQGQAYVTQVINTLMASPNWSSTALFLVWDDWGGFYDHENPPVVDINGYGLRVPGLLISPYAKQSYIDHQILSFDAYLKFIEDVFLNGQRLDPATDGRPDGRPDVRENASILGDLANEFDFTQTPRPPLILKPYPNPTATPTP